MMLRKIDKEVGHSARLPLVETEGASTARGGCPLQDLERATMDHVTRNEGTRMRLSHFVARVVIDRLGREFQYDTHRLEGADTVAEVREHKGR